MSKNQRLEGTYAGKKPYRMPRLHVYGDVKQLTQATQKTGVADGITKGRFVVLKTG